MSRCLLLLLVIIPISVTAQVRHVFEGLARTRVQYISVRSGVLEKATDQNYLNDYSGRLDSTYLDSLRQSLVNLPPFVQASYELGYLHPEPGTGDSARIITWRMTEGRTVFPIISLGGIRENKFYQVGVNDIHFGGRGQEVTAYYLNNEGEHNYQVFFRNPSLRGSRWGYNVESRRYAAVEPLYFQTASSTTAVNYRYSNQNAGGGVSYRTETRQAFSFGVSTFRERYRKISALTDEPTPGPDELDLRKYLIKVGYNRNHLDRHAERTAGTAHHLSVQGVGTRGINDVFLIALHDYRYFRLSGPRGNLAARLRSGLSSNDNTPFAPFVLDSQLNIRGSGNRIDRGTAQLVLNMEYRHTVWQDRRSRFAVQTVGFCDIGTWRNPGGSLTQLWERESLRYFVGGGIRLISLRAHDAVLRLDYGVDVTNTSERGLVAGVGQFF